jgi:Flp pilus assembly protein TadD/2-polyprenyl-3-methyl-5-hydroxy-6-metoxy-1,4-benzoquinol methylase
MNQTIEQAVMMHRSGKLQEAELLYRAILKVQPKHPDANHNLGVLAVSSNKIGFALPLFKTALEANPSQGQFWISYIDALIKAQQLDAARNILEQGKKMGLAGERIDELSKLVTLRSTVASPDKSHVQTETQNKKQFSAKMKKQKKTLPLQSSPTQNRDSFQEELNALLARYQSGQYEIAEKLATEMTKNYPKQSFGWKILGAIFHMSGRLNDALMAHQKVLTALPADSDVYNNLGVTLHDLGRLEDAEESLRKAIILKPDYVEAYSNLGNLLRDLGKLAEAEVSHRQAVVLKPNYAEALNNLGITLRDLGRLEDAEKSFKKAIVLKPDYADAYSNLGNTLEDLGRLGEALNNAVASIRLKSTPQAKRLFVSISKHLAPKSWDITLSDMATAALLEPWSRPADVMFFASRLIKLDPTLIQVLDQTDSHATLGEDAKFSQSFLAISKESSALLHAMLSSSPINDLDLERVLTKLRRHLLMQVLSKIPDKIEKYSLPSLYCYLAKQCFINEYIYFETLEEIEHSQSLLSMLTIAIDRKEYIPDALVIVVACYAPLYSIPMAESLLQRSWSLDVMGIIKQQIQEPLDELNLHTSIPCLTGTENLVSLKVQRMYEENPYPRWVTLPKIVNPLTLNTRVENLFNSNSFRSLDDDSSPQILIAGCGTGQHPLEVAQLIKGANVLAIDLSMASLGYAKRKTTELGIRNIDYAQADILKLRSLGRTFDVIESSGVLHHIEDPFEGWEVLLSLLKPHGLMKLGFYSEIARRELVRIREMIAKEGVGSSVQEMRNYRKSLLELQDIDTLASVLSSRDFFSTSGCRDLLFHVQEHRMTLPVLSKFLQEHDLKFLGFEISSSVKNLYKRRFPSDLSATDLNNWHIYENENPETFFTMYQFWIQKNT